MVRFEAFYTFLLVTVLVAVVSVDCDKPPPQGDPRKCYFRISEVNPDWMPSKACITRCKDDGGPICEAEKCFCHYNDEGTFRE